MITNQFNLDLSRELFVDNFAGGGGASTGAERALGRAVDHAINHDREALGMHRINHPQTVHHLQDVFDVNPAVITERRPVGGCWNSPDCKHFSKAKGGKPLSKKIRGLAFVIFRWAHVRSRVIYMENVEEIQTWGPLLHNPRHRAACDCNKPCGKADPAHKGRTWKAFVQILGSGIHPDHPDIPEILDVLKSANNIQITKDQLLRGFGYNVETREIRACDKGTPTIRKRLFMIARCDGMPIVWPEPTHCAPDQARAKKLKPHRAVAECIDFTLPCPSIFLTKAQARKAKCRRPLAKSTQRRIAVGIDRYVLKSKRPFLVSVLHQGSDRVESIDQPARTITAAHRGEKALCNPTYAPVVTDSVNASTPRSFRADESLRTQCAEVKGGHFELLSANLVREFGQSIGQSVDKAAPTVMPHGQGKSALSAVHLVKNYTGVVGSPVDKSIGTITSMDHHQVCSCHMVRHQKNSPGSEMTESLPTTMTREKDSVVCASLAKLRGTNIGQAADEPLATVSAGGQHHALIAPTAVAYYGSEKDGQAVDGAARTLSTKPRLGLVESEVVAPALTDEQIAGALRVAKFLRSHGIQFAGEFATVNVPSEGGGTSAYVIVDIGLRMLTPRELFRAQGFPDDYIIDRAWVVNPKTGAVDEIRLTKEQQIRMCGNSVCPQVAEALIRANNPEMCINRRKEKRRYQTRTGALQLAA